MADLVDPRWPRLLGLAVHEFRTPISVVAGYIRMLLKDRAGPITDQQRRLLEEAEKSCGRLSGLVAEMSELSNLEAGTATFNRVAIDLRDVLRDAVAAVPSLPERDLSIDLHVENGSAPIQGDAVRLRAALGSLLFAVRRELVSTAQLTVREASRAIDGRPASAIAMGDQVQVDRLLSARPADLTTFDEWRGGCGLTLAIARRVLAAHGARLHGPADGAKAAVLIGFPHS